MAAKIENLILGSASPRRQRLLREAGFDFTVAPTDADEISDSANPVGTVIHNALEKNRACRIAHPDGIILTADTLVWFQGQLVGKPTDEAEAKAFLRAFSGNEQTVFTGVVLSSPNEPQEQVRVEATIVKFKNLTDEDIDSYIRLVKPYDRAGAYDAADYGDMVIESVIGSYTNVVGLPMETVSEMLKGR